MRQLFLRVPEKYVARVDAALRAAGLDVLETMLSFDGDWPASVSLTVIDGKPAPGVPALIAYGGRSLERLKA